VLIWASIERLLDYSLLKILIKPQIMAIIKRRPQSSLNETELNPAHALKVS